MKELIIQLFEKKKEVEELKEELTKRQSEYESIEKQIIEQLEAQGVDSMRVLGVGSITIKPDIHFSYNQKDKEKVLEFFKNNPELKELVEEYVHPSRFKVAMKEYFEKANKLPEFIKFYPETKLLTRRENEEVTNNGK